MNYWVMPSFGKRTIVDNVFEFLARHYGITVEQIKAKHGDEKVVKARHIAMTILRNKTNMTLKEIAFLFNNNPDHSLVIYGNSNCAKGGKFEEEYNQLSIHFHSTKKYHEGFSNIKSEQYKKSGYNFTFIQPLERSGFFYISNDSIEEYKQKGLFEKFNNFLDAYDCSLIPINKTQTKIVLNNFKKIA